MTVVIGLRSGYQIVVEDKSYVFLNDKTGLTTRVFISVDQKRVITVPPEGSIEFFDEPLTTDTIKDLDGMVNHPNEIVEVVEDNDPNIG